MHRWNGNENYPSVITVFSAPNYCGTYQNSGAVLIVTDDKMQIKQFHDSNAPFHLPYDLDLFAWSIPFIANKIGQMLYALISQNSDYQSET